MMEMGFDIPSTVDGPDVEVINRSTLINIHQNIHLLKEPYREIFLLRTAIELSFREIGEVFNKSENWARVTYYRARTSLAEKMRGENNEM
ncbi:DNA-directed RNA polymerase specialized sigma24 family protein [Sporosarcina luteola]|nr:DNA-directed RNA polymerase specialized sigma24 family protein [Sporosarcina luteola]